MAAGVRSPPRPTDSQQDQHDAQQAARDQQNTGPPTLDSEVAEADSDESETKPCLVGDVLTAVLDEALPLPATCASPHALHVASIGPARP